MTIAAGFLYADGVMLCADSQMTVGTSKLDGMKVGRIDATWGQVAATFAGNVDCAAAAFQRCERFKESEEVLASPVDGLGNLLEGFYRSHVFEHPGYESGDCGYSLLLAVRLNDEPRAKLFRTEETILREVRSFDCAGTGEDHARPVLSMLHYPAMVREHAVALASYMLGHVKKHAQYCGGKSVILALQHSGQLDLLEAKEITDLGSHMENVAPWFVWQAQQFILGHTSGDDKVFVDRMDIFRSRMLHARQLWEFLLARRADPQSPTPDPIPQPPWPELRGESDAV